jgi:hypothetical protein
VKKTKTENSEVASGNNKLNERFYKSDGQEELGITHLGFSFYLDDDENDEGVENDLKAKR